MDIDQPRLAALARNGEVPAAVRDALTKAIDLKQKLAATQQQIQQAQSALNATQQDQSRVRSNITSIDRNSKFYAQQMEKMAGLEKQIEDGQSTLNTLRDRATTERAALEQYLATLSVE